MADVVINVGAVSAITAGTGLTGGTITGTGTIAADFGTLGQSAKATMRGLPPQLLHLLTLALTRRPDLTPSRCRRRRSPTLVQILLPRWLQPGK
jgi:hypothetical protein